MKPPSRVRVKPDRYSHRKKIDLKKHRKKRLICGSWKRTEQRNLLIGLRKQSKSTGGTGYINFKALNQKIPQRTIQELETMVETLKSHAVTVTVQQLSRQRRVALAARVPIEVWSQLAEDAAGSVVDPVTSAFSQMMFLCSTEPRSLRNSDPPRSDHCKAQVPSDARTIPFRPMPMPNPALVTLPTPPKTQARRMTGQPPSPSPPPANPSGGQPPPASPLVGSTCSSTNRGATSTVSTSGMASTIEPPGPSATSTTVTPARLLSGPQASGCGRLQSNSPASILPLGQAGGSSTTSASLWGSAEQSSPLLASSSTSSFFNTTTTSSSTSTTSSSSTPAPSSTSSTTSTSTSSTSPSSSMTTSSSSSTTPSSSNTTTSSSTRFGRTSKFAQKDSPRTMGLRCIVDFEKIYSYLSQVHKVNQEHCLTPMESAVVLDLLLSLPEELPLLDCVRLEQHMIQAHASLTSPVSRSEAGSNMAAREAQDGGGAEPVGVFHQAQVSGGREAGIGPLPDGQVRDGLQPTNQGEAAAATAAPGYLVPPRSVATERATAGREGHADGQLPSSQNASGQSRSSSRSCQEEVTNGTATVCPLNPFMVPLQLLARRQTQ